MNKLSHISLYVFLSLALNLTCNAQVDQSNVREFINGNMPKTVRECKNDSLGHIALPYPYSVPCVKGSFQDLFYWDTYFTNVGLIRTGNLKQAKNNTDNILYLINKYGFMPNASSESYLNRSQPPYASMMVRDIYEKTKDLDWLGNACRILEKEYDGFWMKKRITSSGLNSYSNSATRQQLLDFYSYMLTRFPQLGSRNPAEDEKVKISSHFLAEAESGWDFNPRFDSRCEDFNPIDLNANLYQYEKNFEFFYRELGWKGANRWKKLAKQRQKLVYKYCYNRQDGLFYDYDYVNKKQSTVYSAAVFNLLWCKVVKQKQANTIANQLKRLEFAHGVAACEPGTRDRTYQWDYPNGWASVHFLAIKGLDNYGFKEDAKRIARKYRDSIVQIFRSSGNLWEKYNVNEGSLKVNNEYEMPPFMGWTAGTFIYSVDYLEKE